MSVAVINFVDEDYEGQVGELVNPFRFENGQINVVKDPGGPVAIITNGENGGFVIHEVPRDRILKIRVY